MKVQKLNGNVIFNQITKYTIWVFLAACIATLTILSFVDSFGINSQVRSILAFTLISMIMAITLWRMFVNKAYDRCIEADTKLQDGIHFKFYLARKGFTDDILRERISKYNRDFKQTYIEDIEDITGRKETEIREGKYKGNSYKFLIWRIKHRRYPSTGIKSPRTLLNVLAVSKSASYKFDLNKDRRYINAKFASKIITTALMSTLTGMVVVNFTSGDVATAIYKLLMSLTSIIISVGIGSFIGNRAGNIRLQTGLAIAELLSEWRTENGIAEKIAERLRAEKVNKAELIELLNIEKPINKESQQFIELT